MKMEIEVIQCDYDNFIKRYETFENKLKDLAKDRNTEIYIDFDYEKSGTEIIVLYESNKIPVTQIVKLAEENFDVIGYQIRHNK